MAKLGRLRLHVLPCDVGVHSLQQSLLTLMSFTDSAPVAYVEGFQTGNLMDDPRLVASSRTACDLALGDALSHQESVARVRVAAEEREHGQRQAERHRHVHAHGLVQVQLQRRGPGRVP
ncbi:Scr1 family TA system antitoxin-like transcriptional regulator [Streptomyces griseus]|uniref:Scr1 family TA system antitoxin-like transcriptional regulator n=2 Tax=Streptomyces TaxID=1883 RepID=A0ABU2WB78_9ACTN|nr:Scr1 family TA system antitoxin-like transcriptional regulator [Streptomyces griseus]MDT0495141.1 Scr1 family TA system antitoxin-like transcriptional regulator [Streptomyces griseus]